MTERLPARLEVAALLRQAESSGGFAMVARSGDPDRGDILVHIVQRGIDVALLERRLGIDFTYRWSRQTVPNQGIAAFSGDRSRIDPDFWLIELDIADAERFVAEMIASG